MNTQHLIKQTLSRLESRNAPPAFASGNQLEPLFDSLLRTLPESPASQGLSMALRRIGDNFENATAIDPGWSRVFSSRAAFRRLLSGFQRQIEVGATCARELPNRTNQKPETVKAIYRVALQRSFRAWKGC